MLPQTQRVTLASSSSSPASGTGSSSAPSSTLSSGTRSSSFSFFLRLERPVAAPWAELDDVVEPEWAFLRSTTGSSMSSCLSRLPLLPLGCDVSDGRCGPSLGRGSGSESGDLDVLVEPECAERRPERRVSRGESGGPIDDA